jgi:septum formation protein
MKQFADYMNKYRIFLGSRSPRRLALLKDIGLNFELWLKTEVPEVVPDGLSPGEAAVYLARLKAKAYLNELQSDDILITADTLVVLGDRILGKPDGREEAITMLTELAGQPHEVITGVCLSSKSKDVVFTANTTVWFDTLSAAEIVEYVDEFSPFDKAGAYGIQEWIGYIGVKRIEGSYFNVMGLPVQKLYRELQRFTGFSYL